MRIVVNRWQEKGYRREFVGCIGYDDPVYENVPCTVNKEESLIEFDDVAERRKFFYAMLNLKPKADEILYQRKLFIKAHYDAEWSDAISKWVDDFEEYVGQMQLYQDFPLWKKLFTNKPQCPERPELDAYREKAAKAVRNDPFVISAKYVLGFPHNYEQFIERVHLEDYWKFEQIRDIDPEIAIAHPFNKS